EDSALQPQPDAGPALQHDRREVVDAEIAPRAAPGKVGAGVPGAEAARYVERAEAPRPAQQGFAGLPVGRRLEGRAGRKAPALHDAVGRKLESLDFGARHVAWQEGRGR